MLVVQGLSLPIAWDRVAKAASWAQSEAPERASEVLYTQALLWGGRFHCVGHTGGGGFQCVGPHCPHEFPSVLLELYTFSTVGSQRQEEMVVFLHLSS